MMKPKFTAAGISKKFANAEKRLDLVVIRELQLLGEKIVNLCRDLDTYMDQTGNLRASIGYQIYVNFTLHSENFVTNPGRGTDTGEIGKNNGEAEAKNLGETIVSSYYSLIVVAGMDYAEEVEARDYAVITPGEQLAEAEFPKIIARIKRSLNSAA